MILLQLFTAFLQIGLFSIGGGYAAIPLIREQAVALHGWLTETQFMDLATIAEMTPGPIVVNGATFAGLQVAGLSGALIATFGSILPSILIVSLLAWVYRRWRELPMLQSVLASLRPAVVALIAAAGVRMLLQVVLGNSSLPLDLSVIHWDGILLFAAAFILLRKTKLGPITVMLMCGGAGLLLGLAGLA